MFVLKNITKSYDSHIVVNNVSIEAQAGEVIALLGPSGAGKSTLLKCANLLVTPEQGEISLAKKKIDWSNKKQLLNLRKNVSMVFQNFNLWQHKTALQNIIEAPIKVLKQSKQYAKDNAYALLAKVGLSDKADSYPKYLSGGQQQRVAIARALAMNPKVLLFDEPTASLDPETVQEVLQTLKVLADEGKTMIIATHEMGFAKQVADKIIFMEKGKIVAQGNTEDMFNKGISKRFKQFIGE